MRKIAATLLFILSLLWVGVAGMMPPDVESAKAIGWGGFILFNLGGYLLVRWSKRDAEKRLAALIKAKE